MAHDTSFTAYKAREKDNKGHHDGEYHKPDKEKMEETWRKWKLRKAQGAFNLKKFLGNKVQKDNTKDSAKD